MREYSAEMYSSVQLVSQVECRSFQYHITSYFEEQIQFLRYRVVLFVILGYTGWRQNSYSWS